MPSLVKDGSVGDEGLMGEPRDREHELCSSDSSEESNEVIALVKIERDRKLAAKERENENESKNFDPSPLLKDQYPPSDNIDSNSSVPSVVYKDKSPSPSKKTPKIAHGPTEQTILGGDYSKRMARENVSPQKMRTEPFAIEALGCNKAETVVSASGRGSADNSSCILLNGVKDICGNTTVDGKVGTDTERIGDVARGRPYASASHVTNARTLKKEGGGGESCGVRTRARAKLIKQNTPSDAAGSTNELNQVKAALNKHTIAVHTLLRQAASTGDRCAHESLLKSVRKETMSALQNAMSKAENDAIRLYTEEIMSKEKEKEKKKQKQQRLEAMNDGEGPENERQSGTKLVLGCTSAQNSDFPATSKRPRSGNDNENENGPEKRSKGQKKTCSSEGCTNGAIQGGVC